MSHAPPPCAGAVAALLAALAAAPAHAAPVHTSYLWHMHQPIYWPERSVWAGLGVERAYETITLGHGESDVFSIFNSDDRVRDYQDYPKIALQNLLDLPDAGAQVSFAGSLIQNLNSLGQAGWNGGRYAAQWHQPYRDAMAWTTSGGRPRLDPVLVGFHHAIGPLVDEAVFRRQLQTQKAIMPATWGGAGAPLGFFPAEMCFSERLIPALVAEGVAWSVVPDVHIARACAGYPWAALEDQCDPPNRADQQNPAQSAWQQLAISRGVTTKVPVPFGLTPHRAQHVDPETGAIASLVVVPAANGMSWNEGYGLYGTGEIDAIAAHNDPARPMLVLFAHDGDNAWSGGNSYYEQNVTQFSHAAAARGYEPTTVAEYLADHPVAANDVVKVEDGGWVNADGDFGSPQFINWNWPLVNAAGQFDIPNGWAEDERNWAVLTAATNRVLTAEQIAGPPVIARIVEPTQGGATAIDLAWHHLLVGFESGYMYYGASLDFEIKPTLAANRAIEYADAVLGSGPDATAPTVWLPQRLPWNPGGRGGGALWGYPGGAGAAMPRDFHVWTFVHDVSGVASVTLRYRIDHDGVNPIGSIQNETYAGGPEVGAWQSLPMTRRPFPPGNVHGHPEIDFTVMPARIADQYWALVAGLSDALVDYHVEAVDSLGHVRRSPIQHVYVGTGAPAGGGPAVRWTPAAPAAGDTLTIRYDAVAGALPDEASPVYVHVGHSGWTDIVTPDPAMTWDPDSAAWIHRHPVPATATSVDFVFRDGAGHWDNNGGADWHVSVTGAAAPAWVLDGQLDPGLTPVASCAGLDLHAAYDGRWLHVAIPAVAATSGLDHFALIARASVAGTQGAPWAKAGAVATLERFLAQEDGNGWSGWFTGAGAQTQSGLAHVAGAWLEGRVDALALWGEAPDAVRVAFAAYATPDGGALARQIPCALDGDGDVEAIEWHTLTAPTTAVAPAGPAGPALRLRSPNPARGALRATVEPGGGGAVTVELLDLAGRRVLRLHDGAAHGGIEVDADLDAAALPAGIYVLRARSAAGAASVRIARLP